MTLSNSGRAILLLVAALCCAQLSAGQAAAQETARELGPGEATIRYLYHSGWVVETRRHLLVFDYSEPPSASVRRSPDSGVHGVIDFAAIGNRNVTVFVSHSHGDHYDPVVLDWRGAAGKIRYVWGWEGGGAHEDIHFGAERQVLQVDGLEILNVHHDFDEIPESAFLVRVDGLTILHAGDHGSHRGMENPVFRENILYFAEKAPRLDLFFTPTFGGEIDAIRALSPQVVMPMHSGGLEREYTAFSRKVASLGLEVQVGAAKEPGDLFLYSGGKLTSLLPERLSEMIRRNSFREAVELAGRLLADGAANDHVKALSGLAGLKAGRIEEAEAIFREVISASPDNPEAHLGLGRIARIRNEQDTAVLHLRNAVASGRFRDEAFRQLWRAAWDRGVVADLLEIHDMAEERYGRDSEPLPGWMVNGFAQVEGLAGQRLYRMEGRSDRLSVPLTRRNGSGIRMISFTINGQGEYAFDIDSAAPGFMTISPLLAEELRLSLSGSSSAVGVGTGSAAVRFSVLDSVALGGIVFRNVPVMVSDLFTFRGKKKGLIGAGLLKRFNVTIDDRAGVMHLYPLDRPEMLRASIDPAAVAAEVPLHLFDATTVEASMAGAPPALFILDTAASTNLVDDVFLREQLKDRLGRARMTSTKITGSQGTQQSTRIEGLQIEVGPLGLDDQVAHEFSMSKLNAITGRYAAGLLGNPVLRPYRVHMDFHEGRLILETYPEP